MNDTVQRLGKATEGNFAGLRFVRNWMGYHADPADFIQPRHDAHGGEAPVAAWTWNPLPAVELGAVSPAGRGREAARHRHYATYLAGKPLGQTVTRAVAFLNDISPARNRVSALTTGRADPLAGSPGCEAGPACVS